MLQHDGMNIRAPSLLLLLKIYNVGQLHSRDIRGNQNPIIKTLKEKGLIESFVNTTDKNDTFWEITEFGKKFVR